MAASATLLTTGGYSATTLTTTLVSNTFNTGTGERIIMLVLAADNYGTSGAGSVSAPTSSPSLAWSPVFGTATSPSTFLNGGVTYPSATPAVGSGTTLAVWYVYLSSAVAAQDVTVTFNFSPATRTKVYQVWRIDATSFVVSSQVSSTPSFFGPPAGSTTGTPSITGGNSYIGQLTFGISAAETNAVPTSYAIQYQTWTGTAETIQSSGSVTTSQRLYCDWRVESSVTTPVFNFTQGSTVDTQMAMLVVGVWEPPDPPSNVKTIGDNQNEQATLSWTAPSNLGGVNSVYDYSVQYRSPAGTGAWTTWVHTASNATTATITGLTNGQSYEFQVATVTKSGTPTKTSAWSSSVYAQPTLHEINGGNARVRDGWGLNTGNLSPETIIPWIQFWTVESPLFRSYINAGTVTDGVSLNTAGVTFLPQIGTATAGSNFGVFRKNRSELGNNDAIGRPRQTYSLLSPYATGAFLEIWWVANMVDVALPTSGTTTSHWFGWPTTGFGSQSLYDYRTTTAAYWVVTDTGSTGITTTGSTAWTDANTHLYRLVLVSGTLTANLYRDNILFMTQSGTAAYYNSSSSSSFNVGYGVSGAVSMRPSGGGPTPSGPGPLVPFWGMYTSSQPTTATQQAQMLRWARAKYGVA